MSLLQGQTIISEQQGPLTQHLLLYFSLCVLSLISCDQIEQFPIGHNLPLLLELSFLGYSALPELVSPRASEYELACSAGCEGRALDSKTPI